MEQNKYDVALIIPTYNSLSKVLGDKLAYEVCLESILEQFNPDFKLQLIFVDDYSSDDTIKHTKAFCEKNNITDVQFISMVERGYGPGPGRNYGMSFASSEYIAFMDNDDQLNGPDCLYDMFKYAKQNNSDILMGKMKGKNGFIVEEAYQNHFNIPDLDLREYNYLYSWFVNGKLFKLDFIKKHDVKSWNLEFEDFRFWLQACMNNPKISVLTDKVYYYWVKTDSEHLSGDFNWDKKFNSINGIFELLKDANPIIKGSALNAMFRLDAISKAHTKIKARKDYLNRVEFHLKFREAILKLVYEEDKRYFNEKTMFFFLATTEYDYLKSVEMFKTGKFLNNDMIYLTMKNNSLSSSFIESNYKKHTSYKRLENKCLNLTFSIDSKKNFNFSYNGYSNYYKPILLLMNREKSKKIKHDLSKLSYIKTSEILDVFYDTHEKEVIIDFFQVVEDEFASLYNRIKAEELTKSIKINYKDSKVSIYKNWKNSLSIIIKK